MSGRSVVKDNIPWGGVLAYTRGQTIDNDVVKEHGWEDLVVGEGTKEARAIHAEITGQVVDEPALTSRTAAQTSEQKG